MVAKLMGALSAPISLATMLTSVFTSLYYKLILLMTFDLLM
jgi:hypothetical protein